MGLGKTVEIVALILADRALNRAALPAPRHSAPPGAASSAASSAARSAARPSSSRRCAPRGASPAADGA
eukprot:9433582-Pyramimonas_sp.AAC.2